MNEHIIDARIGQKYLFDYDKAQKTDTIKRTTVQLPKDSIVTLTKVISHENYFYDNTYYFTINGLDGEFWTNYGWRLFHYNDQNMKIVQDIRAQNVILQQLYDNVQHLEK